MSDKPVAIVTNATEYAGPGSVEALSKEGFQLVCHDLKFSEATVREAYQVANGCLAVAPSTPESLVADTVKRFGRLDALVSNDIVDRRKVSSGTIDEIGAETFRAEFEALTVTPFRLCAAAAPAMKQQSRGQIVLVTSGAGVKNPVATFAEGRVRTSYVIGRQATNTLARCLAVELAPFGIQVNAVAPYLLYSDTFFPSPLGADDPKFEKLLAAKIPMNRWGRAEEIGALIALLASGRAGFVSGQVIAFSGAGV